MERLFGDYMHQKRIEKGVSLRTAASKMGFSAMYLSEIESGKKIPSGAILRKLASYYDVFYFSLLDLCSKSCPQQETTRTAVARMVDGLSEEEAQKVMTFIQHMEKEE